MLKQQPLPSHVSYRPSTEHNAVVVCATPCQPQSTVDASLTGAAREAHHRLSAPPASECSALQMVQANSARPPLYLRCVCASCRSTALQPSSIAKPEDSSNCWVTLVCRQSQVTAKRRMHLAATGTWPVTGLAKLPEYIYVASMLACVWMQYNPSTQTTDSHNIHALQLGSQSCHSNALYGFRCCCAKTRMAP